MSTHPVVAELRPITLLMLYMQTIYNFKRLLIPFNQQSENGLRNLDSFSFNNKTRKNKNLQNNNNKTVCAWLLKRKEKCKTMFNNFFKAVILHQRRRLGCTDTIWAKLSLDDEIIESMNWLYFLHYRHILYVLSKALYKIQLTWLEQVGSMFFLKPWYH